MAGAAVEILNLTVLVDGGMLESALRLPDALVLACGLELLSELAASKFDLASALAAQTPAQQPHEHLRFAKLQRQTGACVEAVLAMPAVLAR